MRSSQIGIILSIALSAKSVYGAVVTIGAGDMVDINFRLPTAFPSANTIGVHLDSTGPFNGYDRISLFNGVTLLGSVFENKGGGIGGILVAPNSGLGYADTWTADLNSIRNGSIDGRFRIDNIYNLYGASTFDTSLFSASAVRIEYRQHFPLQDKYLGSAVISSIALNETTIWSAPTIQQIIDGAIRFNVTADNKGIVGSFTPNLGMTLSQAATAGGYDHFDWLQINTAYPGGFCLIPPVFSPFIDPPSGCAVPSVVADSLPFYWDENFANALPGYRLEDNISSNGAALSFVDYPCDASPLMLLPGAQMSFHTYLAGVRKDNTYDIISKPEIWSSNNTPYRDGIQCLGRNITPPVDVTGGATASGFGSLRDVSVAERVLVAQSGGTFLSAVPESSPRSLMGVALFACLLRCLGGRQRFWPRAGT
jgi:hypothetical protein